MSSKAKKIAEKVNPLTFEPDMYNNMYGSLIISYYILTGAKNATDIKKQWRKWRKGKFAFIPLADPDFIKKNVEMFGLEYKELPIAYVQSKWNVLFLPYVDGQLLPIREDGILPFTARKGDIYPIDWSNNE